MERHSLNGAGERAALRAAAASAALPEDLDRLVRSILARQPHLSWDDAVSVPVRGEGP